MSLCRNLYELKGSSHVNSFVQTVYKLVYCKVTFNPLRIISLHPLMQLTKEHLAPRVFCMQIFTVTSST